MLIRFVLYSLIAYLVISFVRKLLSPAKPARTRSANMVRCERCGVFVTQSSALMISGRSYCSSVCAQVQQRG